MPDLLDLGRLLAAILGQRQLGDPGRSADAKTTGHQLEQRPAAGRVQPVQPIGDNARQLALARGRQRGHDRVQRGPGALARRLRPSQRCGLGEIADKVIGPAEQDGIGSAGHQLADHPRLGLGEAQSTGQGSQPPATVRIGHGAEIGQDQRDFDIALW